MEFYGPAADRIDEDLRTRSAQVGRLAEQLMATAGLLERAASDVEAEQAARLRELQRLRDSLSRRIAP